ncbi:MULTISPECIES: exodeoxyribonuclease VII large subunit [Rhodomicrobium]|uniref:exodeoxyribonuclease VII large subunit n=1 Tax=Rhodomicrobium TaxID=1068 RepID=UPI000B4B586D|nr:MULTISPECIES: exodeoxyribonuclease VII large subunit [Rhodomicrobium]
MNDTPIGNVAEYTVTELSMAVKRTVEDSFGYVRLRGEISGFRGKHSSGHAYFALKDDRAKIDAVIWKGTFAGLRFKPEEGMEVIATGRVTTYPGKSSYQIIIEALEPAGIGALMALLEERKKRLAAEGLFDEARKKLLPFLPRVIGVITSPTGSVIRDILHGFAERFPPACVFIWPVRVQGETCAAEVAAALHGFNRLGPGGPVARPDIIIVARGGGSLEDLWGFNEEIVARAVAASVIPVISAVGHETDWTLIDYVADARAPTPTKAAEWAVPKHSELIARMTELRQRQRHAVIRAIEGNRSDLRAAARGLPKPQDLIGLARQRFDGASGRLRHALRGFASEKRGRLERWQGRLDLRLITQRAERCHERLRSLDREMRQVVRRHVQQRHVQLGKQGARLQPGLLRYPALRGRERLDVLAARAGQCLTVAAERRRRRIDSLAQLLRSLSHKSVLDRGFALVRDSEGRMLRRAAEAEAAGWAELEFCDGRVGAEIEPGLVAGDGERVPQRAGAGEAANRKPKKAKDKQGQLF